MNKEELLQKIKDEVAREYDWKDYEEACRYVTYDEKGNYVPVIMRYVNLCDEIARRYAIACCEEQKRVCSENATLLIERANKSKVFSTGQLAYFAEEDDHIEVDKQSILNTKNVAE